MSKKKIVLLMNCAADELFSHFSSSGNLKEIYDIFVFYTYVSMEDESAKREIYKAISDADVLITQNVKSVEWLTNSELKKVVKNSCKFIQLAFWRFDGYWPVTLYRSNVGIWFFPIEFGDVNSFEEYISAPVDADDIRNTFNAELSKFSEIDEESDIRMFDFFMENYKKHSLFSDNWHPSSFFFYEIVRQIFEKIGVEFDVNLRANDTVNRNRYRFVLNSVSSELDLLYDQSYLRFYQYFISREVFFHFCKYAQDKLETQNPSEAAILFETWRSDNKLDVKLMNVVPLGASHQSSDGRKMESSSSRSVNDDLVICTDVESNPWWSLDLRDTREIVCVKIWPSIVEGAAQEQATSLSIEISANGDNWKEISQVDIESCERGVNEPFVANFVPPLTTRYIRLAAKGRCRIKLHNVEIFSEVINWEN